MAVSPRDLTFLATVLVLLSSVVEAADPKEIDIKKCKELGFTGEAKCTACDSMAEFVKDKALVAECKQCCVQDEAPKYTSVELQASAWRLGSLPEIKHFVDNVAPKYSKVLKVSVKSNSYSNSRLKCKKEDGTYDIIHVDGWKRSSFDEFLADRVVGGAGTAKA